ncbi:MAG: PKD domain-containing protein, partial [Micromonosporaceae bacterium]|nr:PKD domain-containing protein [Micromonosporaceae bacterium]
MRSSIRVAGFAAVAMVAASLPGQVANADSPTTLYVRGGVTCSDTGPGSQADPFCTIQHAADVVNPGQTVLIDGTTATFTHVYDEAVTVTRSGTPEAPIVFTGTGPGGARAEILPGDGPAAVVTLTGVHDVRLEHLDIMHLPGQDGVDLQGVHGVTVDGFTIATVGGPVGPGGNGVTIDGSSSDVTVSRNGWENAVRFGTYGVQALSGASNITVTANSIWAEAGAVRLTGVSGAAVTSNGMTGKCGPMIGVDGTSSAVVVENNVVGPFPPTTNCATGTATALWVSADSATGVRADYNAVQIGAPDYVYDWAGTTYPTLQQFQAGTGQGAHDVPVPNYADGGGTPRGVPPEGSPLVDSADATAPGELGTDLSGRPHVDDPLVGNTGTGLGYHDRGAIELQDALPLAPVYTPSNTRGPAPLDLSVALDAPAVSPWAEPVTYTVDFGDGDGPVPVTAGTATHTYQTPGTYTATVAAADTGGSTSTVTQSVIVGTTLPNVPTLAVGPYTSDISGAGPSIGPALANFSVDKGGNDWEVTDDRLSFGDGTTAGAGGAQPVGHQFPGPGTYTATLTQTDVLGRVSTASTRATVGDEYFPVAGAPIRV